MKVWAVVASICAVAALSIGCNATSRHKVLSFFFDGVPPPRVAETTEGKQLATSAGAVRSRKVGYRGHGPFAARMCNACHETRTTNALVAPVEQLCLRCHEFRLEKKYIHGPLASGGCRVCHEPHNSQYRYLLVSESDAFCSHCHEGQTMARIGPHGSMEEKCTACHDAHMSDKKYLLR